MKAIATGALCVLLAGLGAYAAKAVASHSSSTDCPTGCVTVPTVPRVVPPTPPTIVPPTPPSGCNCTTPPTTTTPSTTAATTTVATTVTTTAPPPSTTTAAAP